MSSFKTAGKIRANLWQVSTAPGIDPIPMDCVHMRAGVQTQATFLQFILMIMNCIHLRRPQCELWFLEILSVINSSSLVVLHGSQSVFLSIMAGLSQQHDSVQADTETLRGHS